MKEAIIALDGGGSNLRILIVDSETNMPLFEKKIDTGTNLVTVENPEEALNNIKSLILEGYETIKVNYHITGICLSSAGTEIKGNIERLENAIKEILPILKDEKGNLMNPKITVIDDIKPLLKGYTMAIVAGTGTVAAVSKDDNSGEIIKKYDGRGPNIGDTGSAYWIAMEVLKKVADIIDYRRLLSLYKEMFY